MRAGVENRWICRPQDMFILALCSCPALRYFPKDMRRYLFSFLKAEDMWTSEDRIKLDIAAELLSTYFGPRDRLSDVRDRLFVAKGQIFLASHPMANPRVHVEASGPLVAGLKRVERKRAARFPEYRYLIKLCDPGLILRRLIEPAIECGLRLGLGNQEGIVVHLLTTDSTNFEYFTLSIGKLRMISHGLFLARVLEACDFRVETELILQQKNDDRKLEEFEEVMELFNLQIDKVITAKNFTKSGEFDEVISRTVGRDLLSQSFVNLCTHPLDNRVIQLVSQNHLRPFGALAQSVFHSATNNVEFIPQKHLVLSDPYNDVRALENTLRELELTNLVSDVSFGYTAFGLYDRLKRKRISSMPKLIRYVAGSMASDARHARANILYTCLEIPRIAQLVPSQTVWIRKSAQSGFALLDTVSQFQSIDLDGPNDFSNPSVALMHLAVALAWLPKDVFWAVERHCGSALLKKLTTIATLSRSFLNSSKLDDCTKTVLRVAREFLVEGVGWTLIVK